MRRRLRVVRDSSRLRFDVADRLVEVVDAKQTGEVLLDEALKMIKSSEEKRTVADWIDLLSGEFVRKLQTCMQFPQLTWISMHSICRRDMELVQDRLPAQASARASGKGSRRQGSPSYRKA